MHFSSQGQHFWHVVLRVFCESRRGVLRHMMKIDGSLTRNIDFEVANFEVHEKTRRKTLILKLQSAKNWDSLARTARGSNMSRLDALVFFCRRRVYGGICTSFPFRRRQSRLWCSFAWQAWHLVTFLRVCKSVDFFLCDRRNTFALYTWHLTLYTLNFTLHTLHSTLYTLHFTLHTQHYTLYTWHSTLYTLHSKLHTLHIAPYTLHSTLYTPTLYTPHLTLRTLDFTLHTPHSTFYTLHSTLRTLHFTLHTSHSIYTLPFTLHTLNSTLFTLHSSLHTDFIQFTFYTYTLHSTLNTPRSTLCTLHLELRTLHSTLNT